MRRVREPDQRAVPEAAVFLVHFDQFPVEADHLPVFPSPGVGAPVVRIRETAQSRLIPVVKSRRAGPGQLDDHCLAINALPYIFCSRLGSQERDSAHFQACPCQKARVVVVGKLVHAAHQRRLRHVLLPLPLHGCPESVRVADIARMEGVVVLLHTCQKPCDRVHETLVVHDGIPLFAAKPARRVHIILGEDEGIGVRFFDNFAESLPEVVVEDLGMPQVRCHVQSPAVRVVRGRYPFGRHPQDLVAQLHRFLVVELGKG